jgi:hypothetical protein
MRSFNVTIKQKDMPARTIRCMATSSIDAMLAMVQFMPRGARVIARPA